jgi:hypothetical protein
MTSTKKILLSVLFTALLVPVVSMASTITLPNALICGDLIDCLDTLADSMIDYLGPVAVLVAIYAAFLFITSAGEPAKITQAKSTLTYALVGTAFILVAKSIALLIEDILS